MGMPQNLFLVRHGQSEANVMQKATKNGDDSYYTDEIMTVPDRAWRLTEKGVQQAQTIGTIIPKMIHNQFDRTMVSPYVRTRETAAQLQLEQPNWEENRIIRERSWGEISSIPRSQFKNDYPRNAALKENDPLYWTPPAGESIANVAENRVRNLLDTLHRECNGKNVLLVTHGDFIWATRLTLERWSDEEFLKRDNDPNERIKNCEVFQYSRINPITGAYADKLKWIRRGYPNDDGTVTVTGWYGFERPTYTNEELLTRAKEYTHNLK